MAEQRLIDANAIRYEPMLSARGNGQYEDVMVAYKDQIDDLPIIEERKNGKWIDKGIISNYPEEGFNIYHLLVCDQCGCMHRTTVWCVNEKYINADFCPNCGALMGGEKNGID